MTAAGWALLGVSLALTGIAAGTAWRAAGRAVAAERSAQWARRHAVAARDRARHYVDEAIAAAANARGVDASLTTPGELALHEQAGVASRASVEGPAGDGEAAAPSSAAAPAFGRLGTGDFPDGIRAGWLCPCGEGGYLLAGASPADVEAYESDQYDHDELCPQSGAL